MTSLDLSSNYLTAEGCRLLGEASGADGCGALRTLVLRENPIGPEGAALIGKVSPGRGPRRSDDSRESVRWLAISRGHLVRSEGPLTKSVDTGSSRLAGVA